jgi:tetratricopeptide (TPR) repeat protein
MIKEQIKAMAPILTFSNTGVAQPTPVTHAENNYPIQDSKPFQNFTTGTSFDFAYLIFAVGIILGFGYTVGLIFSKTLDFIRAFRKTESTHTQLKPEPQPLKEFSPSSYKKSNSAAYIEKAYTRLQQGDAETAIAELNKAICFYPEDPHLYTERANFRRRNLGDRQGALEDYTQAISLNPNNALYYLWRSQLYHETGDQSKAMADYNTAIRLAPQRTMYHCFNKN